EAEVDVGGVEVELAADGAPVLKILRRRGFRGERFDRGKRSGSERTGDEETPSVVQHHSLLCFVWSDDNRRMSNRDLLLRILDEAYERKAWHGTNLRGSLRGVSSDTAAWRPARGRHNIREIAVHCAYWKYTVRRRLTGEKRGSFAR